MKRLITAFLLSLVVSPVYAISTEFIHKTDPVPGQAVEEYSIINADSKDSIGFLRIMPMLGEILTHYNRSEYFKKIKKELDELKADQVASLDGAQFLRDFFQLSDTPLQGKSKTVLLLSIYVCPEYRKKGYAKDLIQFACQDIFNNGHDHIVLIPHPFSLENGDRVFLFGAADYQEKQDQLITMFKKYGFEPVQQGQLVYMVKNR